jgi:hypothetical protein
MKLVTFNISFEVSTEDWAFYNQGMKDQLLTAMEEVGNKQGFDLYDSEIIVEDL